MIKVKNVSFSYTKDKNIANDLSVEFELGKSYAIMGQSGVGKSTLLSIFAGIEKPQNGEVYFDGNKSDFKDTIRENNISLIFQNYLLFPYMSAIQNVVTAMDIHSNEKDNKQKAKEILIKLGISEKDLKRPVKKLSGGEQQRVAIARAIAVKSKYIFADEPTGNLDEDTASDIINTLTSLTKENDVCIIIVTHSDEIRKKCDVSYRLTKGTLVLE